MQVEENEGGIPLSFKLIELTKGLDYRSASGAALNNKDDALITLSVNKSTPLKTFVWQRGKLIEVFHKNRRNHNCSGHSINDACQVVGSIGPHRDRQDAFLWQNGEMQILPSIGEDITYAQEINNSALIVGTTFIDGENMCGILWKRSRIIDSGKTISRHPTNFTTINDNGDIAGYEERDDNYYPFRYSRKLVEYLPTNLIGFVDHINSLKSVVGSLSSKDYRSETAFLFANKKLQMLGTLGGTRSRARYINDSMVVVGQSYITNSTDNHAFVWKDGKLIDINSIINAPGIVFTDAVSVNKQGHILCTGISNGRSAAYLIMGLFS